MRTKYGVLNQKQKSRTDKHRSPNPKTVRPKMKTNPDHEERGLAHRWRCCCACAEKEPSKTRAKDKHNARSRGKRRRQISQVCWKPRGYWNSRRPRVEHDQSRDGREKRSEACGRKGKGREWQRSGLCSCALYGRRTYCDAGSITYQVRTGDECKRMREN